MYVKRIYMYRGGYLGKILLFISAISLFFLWCNNFFQWNLIHDISNYELSVVSIALILVISFYVYGGHKFVKMRIEIDNQKIKFSTHNYHVLSNWEDIFEIILERYTSCQ
jgi:hypothetical protein